MLLKRKEFALLIGKNSLDTGCSFCSCKYQIYVKTLNVLQILLANTWISYSLLCNKLFLRTTLKTTIIYCLSQFLPSARGLMDLEDPFTWWLTPLADDLVLAVSRRSGFLHWEFLPGCSHNTTWWLASPWESNLRDPGKSHMSFTSLSWKLHNISTDFQESHNSILSKCENGPSKYLNTRGKDYWRPSWRLATKLFKICWITFKYKGD